MYYVQSGRQSQQAMPLLTVRADGKRVTQGGWDLAGPIGPVNFSRNPIKVLLARSANVLTCVYSVE